MTKLTAETVFDSYEESYVKSPAHQAFLDRFYQEFVNKHAAALPVLEILEEDYDGNGYFGPLVYRNTGHRIGTVLRAWTSDINARRVLVLVTHVGNVVMFERYSDGDHGVIVTNVPDELRTFVCSGATKEHIVDLVFGFPGSPNLAEALTVTMKRFAEMDFTAKRFTRNAEEA